MDAPLDTPLDEIQDLNDTKESPVDYKLEKLWYQDFERLLKAQNELSLKVKDVSKLALGPKGRGHPTLDK